MQFKIGQPMITIMNISNIIVQHTIKIFKYPPHFCSTNYTTKVYNWSVLLVTKYFNIIYMIILVNSQPGNSKNLAAIRHKFSS